MPMFQKRGFYQRILAIVLIVIVTSCTSQRDLAEHDRQVTHDSETYSATHVYDKDSVAVMVRVVSVSDTVYRDSVVYRYRNRILRDTIIITDTMLICDTVRVVKYIDNDTWFDNITDKVGGISLLLIVLIFIVQFIKIR